MDGVLLLVAWLVGGVHQMMCKGDVVGRGEEGWRRGEWGENRGGSGGVVGEERGGRGEGHVRFFQKPLEETIVPPVPVSSGEGKGEMGKSKAAAGEVAQLITAASLATPAVIIASEKWEAWRVAGVARMVQQTQQRVSAGDVLILWSEAAVIIMDDHEEAKLLADLSASINHTVAAAASTVAAAATAAVDDATPSTLGPYLGASYVKLIAPNFVVNTFALIDPSGAPILRYNKSHLFPSVEANVQPGPGTLPVVDIPLGRLSVAVWFDMQFPALICQGGRQQVDILLQPSWTWGTVAVPQPWQTVLPLLIRLPHFPSTLAILRVDILLQPSWTWGAIGHMTFETDAVRAAENGLTLLRCSSIGVSGGVSPYYRTLAAREALESGMLTMHLPLKHRAPALYPFIGLPISLLLFVTLFAAFLAISPPYLLRR
ncbi:unnamed protein product [Closterium sp. NIES-64]|nr:unnamed protein product [Closterium sp. NIES-64]